MSFELITDSSANLTDGQIEAFGLHIISLRVRVEGREYLSYEKGKPTDIRPFYDMMREKKSITTSHINYEDCRKVFCSQLDEGKDILYIGFSSALSGTYQAAQLVADDLKPQYPDRKIYCVDSLAASMGEGLLIHYAADLREEGKSIEEVYQWLLDNRLHLCHWFTVDDLFFLKRGGRIPVATALLGTMLGIKPVMHVDDEGRLVPVGKVRGRKNSLDALVQHMEETAVRPAEQTVFISHGDCIEDAEYVKEQVKKRMKVKDIVINYVDPVIGAHSGPGTVALFFLGTKR